MVPARLTVTSFLNRYMLYAVQESLKLLYREIARDEEDEDGATAAAASDAASGGTETWNERTYHHVDVVAADHVFTDNTDAVVNTETRSVPVTPGQDVSPAQTHR